jgi:RNA polymerase sigma-70 factor, ECF subfamily
MDSKEFDIKVVSLKDKVFRFAKKILNDGDDAEDVVQDLFEKLWKMKNQLQKYDNIEAFVIKTTRNLCLDKLKHEKINIQKTRELQFHQQTITIPDESEKKEINIIIKSTIQHLPEKQKLIIHLRDIEGYEFDEIVKIMEMDVNAVRMNLSRARKAVKEKIIYTMNYGL